MRLSLKGAAGDAWGVAGHFFEKPARTNATGPPLTHDCVRERSLLGSGFRLKLSFRAWGRRRYLVLTGVNIAVGIAGDATPKKKKVRGRVRGCAGQRIRIERAGGQRQTAASRRRLSVRFS
jgi:hypothetical protein